MMGADVVRADVVDPGVMLSGVMGRAGRDRRDRGAGSRRSGRFGGRGAAAAGDRYCCDDWQAEQPCADVGFGDVHVRGFPFWL
jgi:hypothetical protein